MRAYPAGLLVVLSLIPLAAHGQTSTATISGLVRDPSGGVVSGATVTARHDGTGQTRAARTSAAGNYVITNLPIGSMGERLSEEAKQAGAARIPLGRLCTPEDIAASMAFLASDEASYLTGVCLPVDGGKAV